MITAYSDLYIEGATRILGDAFDWACNTLEMNIDEFADRFTVSYISKQFAIGNPTYVAGMTGCELVLKVLDLESVDKELVMYLDKSPEYWVGYISAYYQWYSNESFSTIFDAMPASFILNMYNLYHEMDITQSFNIFSQEIRKKNTTTRLSMYRHLMGLSQTELSRESGVPLRQIQLFEQRQRDINNAKLSTVYMLSKALNCSVEQLFEKTGPGSS